MKKFLTFILTICTLTALGQQMTFMEWDEQAKTNMRLLPEYGHQPKTEYEKESDEKFINEVMQQQEFNGDKKAASNHLIELGFNYLYRGDLKTAMYRFNQAYLLDSSNTDIYWGYGAVYMTLKNFEFGKKQYSEGLSIDPANTHLLTDCATYFMEQYIGFQMMPGDVIKNPKEQAENYLDSALLYLNKSYLLNPKDQNTTYKLSTSFWYKGDSENAWKYNDECKALGGQPITEDYTMDLKKKCKRKK